MSTRLGVLLGCRTRTDVLSCLAGFPRPLGIRALARLTNTPPHSVARVIHALWADGLLRKEGTATRPVYSLRADHPDTGRLRTVFYADQQERLRQQGLRIQRRAPQVLAFNTRAMAMIQHANRSHATGRML